jgi:carbamoyl-phosphate synthase large subunit
LDDLQNDITKKTPACFEPALDYIVTKVPRFTFEKFQQTEPLLGTQMKSVGEVMSIGRSFKESFLKALEALESNYRALLLPSEWEEEEIGLESIRSTRFDRLWLIAELLRKKKANLDEIQEATKIDYWFLAQLEEIVQLEGYIKTLKLKDLTEDLMRELKANGFSDRLIAKLMRVEEPTISKKRKQLGVVSSLNQVDTCAGEFEAVTPYYYFAYEDFPAEQGSSVVPEEKKEVVAILGSGPNRIGQGIEFDYCCVKAVEAAQEMGYEAIMINCNPETVSTDYDVSSRLYFEPLQKEYVDRVLDEERTHSEIKGVICQTGGQTALRLSQELEGVEILGTEAAQIDRAEDRSKFEKLLAKLKLKRPEGKTAKSIASLKRICKEMGFPVLVRPSYVLGGRSMHIVRSEDQLERIAKELSYTPEDHWPVLIDRFLEDAIEVDVDCVGDGKDMFVAAIMEHIEEAGIHSGDSSCTLPPLTLSEAMIEKVKKLSLRICRELKLCGFLNIQLAFWKNDFYVLEVNPRASRTLPFVCKATGQDWVKAGTYAMLGRSFKEQEIEEPRLSREEMEHIAVKQVVFPFLKFPGVDVLLGPEMKSTGEIMAVGKDFQEAFAKGLLASNHKLPRYGTAFVSVKDGDKNRVLDICHQLKKLGFRIVATHGTTAFLQKNGIVASGVNKVKEGQPHIVDSIINNEIDVVINTTDGEAAISDSFSIRRSALQTGVPYFTTLTAARAAVNSLERWIRGELSVCSLQEYSSKRSGRIQARSSVHLKARENDSAASRNSAK